MFKLFKKILHFLRNLICRFILQKNSIGLLSQPNLEINNESFFPVERYASTVPLFMQHLPYRDRFSVEGTCRLWRAIGRTQGWKDVKVLRLEKSDWTTTTDDSWKISLFEAQNVARRVGRSLQIIEINGVIDKRMECYLITKQFIRCATNSLISVNLENVYLMVKLAKFLVKIKTLKELTLRFVNWKCCKYLERFVDRLTTFRVLRTINYSKSNIDGKFLKYLDPIKLKVLQLDCYKTDLTYLDDVLKQSTDNLQEIKLYNISEPYQIVLSLAGKQRPQLKIFELKTYSDNALSCTVIKTPPENVPLDLYERLILAAPKLEDVKIRYEQHESLMSDRVLTSMSVNLKNLYLLNLSRSCLGESQLRAITSNLVNLKVFIMDSPQTNVTYEFLSNLPNLHTLKIRLFDFYDNYYLDKYRSIFQYASKQLNLKILDISNAFKLNSLELFSDLIDRTLPLTIYVFGSNYLTYYLKENKSVKLRNNTVILNFEFNVDVNKVDFDEPLTYVR